MLNPVDIRPDHLRIVRNVLREYLPPDVNVWVFGSRANWTATDSSDLDLALKGDSRLGRKTMGALEDAFEDSSLPYTVDVIDLNRISDSFRRIVEAQRVPFPAAQDSGGAKADWRRVALKEVIDLKMSSVDKKTKGNERAVRLCNYTDVYNNSFIYADMDFMMATATEQEISKCSLLVGDVIITKDSEKYDDIGVPALVREDIPNLVCGYHLAILRPSPLEIDGTYLFYALNTNEVQQQFQSYANGITRFGLRKADIGLAEILIPPLPQQRTIAHILGTLDDKIELNRRMNVTLEEMARALFKSWFVDFDPVRAKMDGSWRPNESLPNLPTHLYDLFPDQLVDSGLGKMPKGWEAKRLNHYAMLNPESWSRTNTPRAVEYVDLANTKCGVIETIQHYLWNDAPTRAKRVLRSGDTIVGIVRPGNRSYALVGDEGLTGSTGFAVIRPQDSQYREFLYLASTSPENIDRLAHRADGAAYPAVLPEVITDTEVIAPCVDTNVLNWFSKTVAPIIDKMKSNERESRTLVAQRDALLPRLISGESRTSQLAGKRGILK